jgi:anti-anti-sigma regulatory factor
MRFKIDTKDSYTIVTPEMIAPGEKMAENLWSWLTETGQSVSCNYIMDLEHCQEMSSSDVETMIAMHEYQYAKDCSLVFTGLGAEAMRTIKKQEADLIINIAATMQEAIDIVSMEIVERDLLKEE